MKDNYKDYTKSKFYSIKQERLNFDVRVIQE